MHTQKEIINCKLIFCDFDGVLSNFHDEFGSYITHSSESYGPSESCINRLRNLCEDTNSRIIISSNWRRFANDGKCSFWTSPAYNTVQNPLPKLKSILGDLIIGTLPKDRHINKSQALELWFNTNRIIHSSVDYVIFDDDESEGFNDHLIFKDHFILTNVEFGLTDKDCIQAKQILNN